MSLFKLKHLWSESYPNQEFDQKHLALGQLSGQPALALASYKGILRVFKFSVQQQLKATLIYQNNFESEIISTQFVQNPQNSSDTIGVLLFKKFIYLSFTQTQNPNSYRAETLTIQCLPSFKIQPRNPACLLTLNSSIQQLNPLSQMKIKQSDPIFPCTYSVYNDKKTFYYGDGQELVSLKGGVQQWRIILGQIRQIQLCYKNKSSDQEIVVIFGGNNLWEVSDAVVKRSKVMDQDVICGAILYVNNQNPEEFYNIAVANFQMQILIYTRNYTLIWAIKCQSIPVKFLVFQHPSLKGAIALLSDQGTIQISYGGSELAQTQLQVFNENVDMEQVQLQTRRYLEQIQKQKSKKTEVQLKTNTNESNIKVNVRAFPPNAIMQHVQSDIKLLKMNDGVWECRVQCSIYSQKQFLSNVNISIALPSNIYCPKRAYNIPLIKNKQIIFFNLFCSSQKFPHDTISEIIVKYEPNNKKNQTKVITRKCRLPCDFQSTFVSNQLLQKPENKIVIKASKQLPQLKKVFSEFTKVDDGKNITIQLANGVQCSLGYNKTNNKLKIQSNLFSGLCFMFIAFLSRLQQLSKSANQYTLMIQSLPLEQLASIMKQHFDKREQLKKQQLQLQKKCQQFRAGQKKLLIKLKEKMGSSNQIQLLLQYTYNRLMNSADEYQLVKEELQIINHNLEIALKFVTELAFMKSQATQVCKNKLLGILGYQEGAVPTGQYGWQQKVMGNSAYMLNKNFNYTIDKYTFQQVYKIMVWAISKTNSGQWNQ